MLPALASRLEALLGENGSLRERVEFLEDAVRLLTDDLEAKRRSLRQLAEATRLRERERQRVPAGGAVGGFHTPMHSAGGESFDAASHGRRRSMSASASADVSTGMMPRD